MKILILIICFFLVGCNNNLKNELISDASSSSVNQENTESSLNSPKESINIYLFWGDGCHICENLLTYFEQLEKEYGNYYKLIKYEVWYNEDNNNLMTQVGEKLNQNYFAVPFLVIGDEIIVGYNSSKDNYIKNRIIEEYNNVEYIDIVKQITSS